MRTITKVFKGSWNLCEMVWHRKRGMPRHQTHRVPSAFQLTLYGFRLRKAMFCWSMDTGWAPGKPDLQQQRTQEETPSSWSWNLLMSKSRSSTGEIRMYCSMMRPWSDGALTREEKKIQDLGGCVFPVSSHVEVCKHTNMLLAAAR